MFYIFCGAKLQKKYRSNKSFIRKNKRELVHIGFQQHLTPYQEGKDEEDKYIQLLLEDKIQDMKMLVVILLKIVFIIPPHEGQAPNTMDNIIHTPTISARSVDCNKEKPVIS